MKIPFLSGKKKPLIPVSNAQPVYITKPPKVKKVKQPIMSSYELSKKRSREYMKKLDRF